MPVVRCQNVTDDQSVRVLAEIGQAGGDLGYAVRAAEAAKTAGCWGVKIQVLDPDRIAAPDSPKYWATQPGDDSSQRSVFARNGVLDPAAVKELGAECERIGIAFTGTPFGPDAVRTLVDGGAAALKVASGDITYRRLLDAVAEPGLPVILSTGASTDMEIQRARLRLVDAGVTDLTLLACGLIYPCPDGDAQLRRIPWLKASHGHRVGYSDHTLGTQTAVAAAALGATLLEKHFYSEATGAPDDEMALDPQRMADYVRNAELGLRLAGCHGLTVSEAEQPARVGARRSLRWARDLEPGHVVQPGDVIEQRPHVEGGIAVWFADHVLGGTILEAVKQGDVVTATGPWRPVQHDPYQVEMVRSDRR